MPAGGPRRGVDLATGAPVNTSGAAVRAPARRARSAGRSQRHRRATATTCSPATARACSGARPIRTARSTSCRARWSRAVTRRISRSSTRCAAPPSTPTRVSARSTSLNDPDTFDFLSATLGGLGGFAGPLLTGAETIRAVGSPLDPISSPEQLTGQFASFQFLAINPNGALNFTAQDLGLNLPPASAALLGCGAGFASPCSRQQSRAWGADPAIAASRRPPADRRDRPPEHRRQRSHPGVRASRRRSMRMHWSVSPRAALPTCRA